MKTKTYFRLENRNILEWNIVETEDSYDMNFQTFTTFTKAKQACKKWLELELQNIKVELTLLKQMKKEEVISEL